MNAEIVEPIVTLVPETLPRRYSGLVVKSAITLIIVATIGGGGWYVWKQQTARAQNPIQVGNGVKATENSGEKDVKVEVIAPSPGGVERVSVQPGTVESFEAAELYAKVSGFLAEQTVDIGSRVKAGQLLATIAVPELNKEIERDMARLDHERAKVTQMEARLAAAVAEAKAAQVAVSLATTVHKAKIAYRKYRQKQFTRLSELNDQKAIEQKVVDESQDQFEASVEAENAAREGIDAATQNYEAAKAKINQVKADIEEAKAAVNVAAADLERSRVLFAYTKIVSPYDGVVTKRTFNRGDFIRSADVGGERVPMLAVERTDLMRIVTQVPDRDVPYVDAGDNAEIEIDALPGLLLKGKVARASDSEDAATRTMRTEVDMPNKDGRLRRGMYGRVILKLETPNDKYVTIPSSSLIGKSEGSRAKVRVVRDGVVHVVDVRIGADTGVQVEVVSGLTVSDQVIAKVNGPVDDGSRVTVVNGKK